MTIQSMTGFGRGESQSENFIVVIEIKSVNHRFKDIRFKMPSTLASLEMEMKSVLKESCKRGSFDVYINVKKVAGDNKGVDLDLTKVNSFIEQLQGLARKNSVNLTFSPTDFLRQEFTKDQSEDELEMLKKQTLEAFTAAVDGLVKSRAEEGEKLKQILIGHKEKYEQYFREIPTFQDGFKKLVDERLRKRFSEYKADLNIDEPRFMQEVVYYLEKLDIGEEINRIRTHLVKFENLLSGSSEVGRELEFLLQELGRETNTIGSKSQMEDISERVVQMKVQLEKIREQALNIE